MSKTEEYFTMAWDELLKRVPDINEMNREWTTQVLNFLGWNTAASAVVKMSDDELAAWIENRELPPWLRDYLNLE